MEHHIVVGGIAVVPVVVPVGGLVVYLHVAHPQGAVHLHLGVEEVGSCIAVVQSGIYHLKPPVVGGVQLCLWEESVFPAVVQ